MIVILAGVTMNVLFAWLLFTILASKNGVQLDPDHHGRPWLRRAAAARRGGAASSSRRATGSWPVNGQPVTSWDDDRRGHRRRPGPGSGSSLPTAPTRAADPPGGARADRAVAGAAPYRPAGDRPGGAGPAGGAGRAGGRRHRPRRRRRAGDPVVRPGGADPAGRRTGARSTVEVAGADGGELRITPDVEDESPGRRASAPSGGRRRR